MEKQKIREIKLKIENEFVLNLISYLTVEENYIFVGNENELWFENISHPKAQLIYINDQKKFTSAHTTYISQKIKAISKRIKQKFLLSRVRGLIINIGDVDATVFDEAPADIFIANVKDAKAVSQNKTLIDCFPEITSFNLNADIFEIAQKLQNVSKQKANNELNIFKIKNKPIINNTYFILLTLAFVYLWFQNQSQPLAFVAIHYGATYNPLIVAGEYWRLIASAFMHLDLMHFIFNALFIYRFGAVIENSFPKWRMVLIILISAVMASLFGFAFSTNFSFGASGVAYGFIGVLVFLGFEMRRMFMPLLRHTIIPMLVISTLFSLFMPNIDHFGHLGGFIGGFLAAAIVGVPSIKPFFSRTLLTLATFAILVSGLWVNGVRLTQNHDFDDFNLALISKYLELGETERAEQLAELFFPEVE